MASQQTTTITSLSIAAPAYNESASIERVIRHWVEYLRGVDRLSTFEIVVCNDGSKDETGQILDRLASEIAEVRPVHFAVNQGAAAALANAIAHTTKDWVLLLDSDGQFPVENFPALAAAMLDAGGRAAIGVRSTKSDTPYARFGTWASGALCNLFHGTRYRDFNSALKLVRGTTLRQIHLEARGLNYSTEISSKLIEGDVGMIEVVIEHRARAGGKSSVKLLRDTTQRLLFVTYIGLRQLLFRLRVLQKRRLP